MTNYIYDEIGREEKCTHENTEIRFSEILGRDAKFCLDCDGFIL